MAAPRVRCSCCGDPFDRRAANQFYCAKDDCRKARERDRKMAWRQSVAQREQARWERWAGRRLAA